MLCHPHTRYKDIFVYYFDRTPLPAVEHPDLIGTWIEDGHTLFFFHTSQEQLVEDIARDAGASIIYRACLDYQDWEAGVTVRPFTTRYLQVRPVWDRIGPPEPGKKEIVLDPSVVFGSGFHPTTRLCLETMEKLLCEKGAMVRTVTDLGAGTGLLSIAAAKLGAEEVLGIDNNPLACTVAQNNIRLNGCTGRVAVEERDIADGLPEFNPSSLVIANLYKGLLLQLFSQPSFWKAGIYLISGFTPAMEEELLAALPHRGIRIRNREGSGIWRIWALERADAVA